MCNIKKGMVVFVNSTENKYDSTFGIEAGSRPYLVVSNDVYNAYSPVVNAVPLTSAPRKYSPAHVAVERRFGLNADSTILCEQIKTISKTAITRELVLLPAALMQQVNNCLLMQFSL